MDEIWKRDEVDSPCVKVCVVHPESRICIGCHRTAAEISAWSRMAPEERTVITAALPGRGKLLRGRRRGGRMRTRSG